MTPRQLRLTGMVLALASSLGACYPDSLAGPPGTGPRPPAGEGGGLIGRVTSADSRAPLFGANALLMDADGQVVQSVSADSSGRFAFKPVPPGVYRVRVRAIGYVPKLSEPQLLDARTTVLPEVKLKQDVINCFRVVVTAPSRAKRDKGARATSSAVSMVKAQGVSRSAPTGRVGSTPTAAAPQAP